MTDSDDQHKSTKMSPDSHGRAQTPEFVSLFLAHQWSIHRYIAALLGSQQDAEDLVQETAAVLWKKFAEFEPGTSFYAWSCKTAYLLVLEYRRRKAREASPLEDQVLEQVAAVAAGPELAQEIRLSALAKCLEKLSPGDRKLVDQCYSADIKVKEVAANLQRTAKSVRKSLGRIRRALLECVRRREAAAEREGGSL